MVEKHKHGQLPEVILYLQQYHFMLTKTHLLTSENQSHLLTRENQ